VRLPDGAAAIGSVTLRLDPVPATRCPNGHVRPLDGVAAAISDELLASLLVAQRRRLRRREQCGACGARLDLPPRGTETPVPVRFSGGVITATLEAPFVRCPDCGREQLPTTVAKAIPDLAEAAVAFAVERA
jgi:hypothetical protein